MKAKTLFTFLFILFIFFGCQTTEKPGIELPERGLCAHRGAMGTHPENTIPAFRAAVEAGAHMIEFDVHLTKNKQMVVIHDSSVDRTTNGKGKVSDLTFDEIRELDAGSWKSPEFKGLQIPTPEEVLNEMPHNVWINIHIKGESELPAMLARLVEAQGRLHQAFLACNAEAARTAKEAVPGIKICNMERRGSVQEYVDETTG
ncbi:MAG: glycerophosphodiester phosphodiesterase family protein [Prolixibacteraceae bacterium]|jgi:glycerophosphoryl diester phosphodiesterase|nr:glycerophosphodiester phosphodiesterase family protein [Prolixibacteraceae bacterium]